MLKSICFNLSANISFQLNERLAKKRYYGNTQTKFNGFSISVKFRPVDEAKRRKWYKIKISM